MTHRLRSLSLNEEIQEQSQKRLRLDENQGGSGGQFLTIEGGNHFQDSIIGNSNQIWYPTTIEQQHNHYHNHSEHRVFSFADELFSSLMPVPAGHDCREVDSKVSQCFEGTREQLLKDIESWASSKTAPIYILDGIAGIGKSTVAKSVSIAAEGKQQLAASFFFSRDYEKRKTTKWFTQTIVYQLSCRKPIYRERILSALRKNPDILQKDIRKQFVTLIQEPLHDLLQDDEAIQLVSIDALDECKPKEAAVLLSILISEIPKLPSLRIFLTCRPDHGIQALLRKHQGPRIYHLQDIEESVVELDIRRYIDHCLSPSAVEDALPLLEPPPWQPSESDKKRLVSMAGKLFVIASTSTKFILDPLRTSPGKQLRKILESTGGASLNPMDTLYIEVLRAALPDPVDDWFDEYRIVIGTLIVLMDILPSQHLAQLLGIDVNSIIAALANLHALFPPSGDNKVFRIHHKSLPDFLTDRERCSIDHRFYIDPALSHLHLAECCLRVMDENLKQNICDLPHGEWHKDLDQIPSHLLDGRISRELAYACTYWANHLEQGNGACSDKLLKLLHSLATKNLLFWLEVLAFIGRFDIAWISLDSASIILRQTMSRTNHEPSIVQDINRVLQDGLRCISMHPSLPRLAPMHIYLSVLPFIPAATTLFRLYKHLIQKTITVKSGFATDWDSVSVILNHNHQVLALAYSPTGTIATVFGSPFPRVRLWNARTGDLLLEYPETRLHLDKICKPMFSRDGVYLAVGFEKHVQAWDSSEAIFTQEVRYPRAIAFSSDSTLLACGTHEGMVFVWNMHSGTLVATLDFRNDHGCSHPEDGDRHRPSGDGNLDRLEEREYSIRALLPNFDNPFLVASSRHATRLWDVKTSSCIRTFCHSRHLSFSSAGDMAAILSQDPYSITVLKVNPVVVATLTGQEGHITATSFSKNGHNLLSASDDSMVRLWDIETQTLLSCTPHPSMVFYNAYYSSYLQTFLLEHSGWLHRCDDGMPILLETEDTLIWQRPLFQLDPSGSRIAQLHGPRVNISNLEQRAKTWSKTNTPRDLKRLRLFTFSSSGEATSIYMERDQLVCKVGDKPSSFRSPNSSFNHTLSPCGLLLAFVEAASPNHHFVSVFNLQTGARQDIDNMGTPVDKSDFSLLFSPNSTKLAILKRFHGIYECDVAAGRNQTGRVWVSYAGYSRPEATCFVDLLAYSPNGRLMVSVGSKYTKHDPQIWELNRNVGKWERSPITIHGFYSSCVFSSDGSKLIQAQKKGGTVTLSVWTVPSYHLVSFFSIPHPWSVTSLQFFPDFPHVFVSKSAQDIVEWDIESMRKLSEYVAPAEFHIQHSHSHSPTDHIVLVQRLRPPLFGLLAVKLRGKEVPDVRALCWFPPHTNLATKYTSFQPTQLSVSPVAPLIVIWGEDHPTYQFDISSVELPFSMYD